MRPFEALGFRVVLRFAVRGWGREAWPRTRVLLHMRHLQGLDSQVAAPLLQGDGPALCSMDDASHKRCGLQPRSLVEAATKPAAPYCDFFVSTRRPGESKQKTAHNRKGRGSVSRSLSKLVGFKTTISEAGLREATYRRGRAKNFFEDPRRKPFEKKEHATCSNPRVDKTSARMEGFNLPTYQHK